MMRAEAVRRIGGYSSDLTEAEDYDLYFRLAEVGELANLQQTLLRYRVHSNSFSIKRMESQVRSGLNVRREMLRRRGIAEHHRLALNSADLDAALVVAMVIQGYLWRVYLLLESQAFATIHELLDSATEYANNRHASRRLVGEIHAARAIVHRREGHLTHSMVSSMKALMYQPRRMLRGWRTHSKPITASNTSSNGTGTGNGQAARRP
jgi:hypothetical protein